MPDRRMRHRLGWWTAALQAAVALPVVAVLLRLRGYAGAAQAIRTRSLLAPAPERSLPVPLEVRVVTSAVTTIAGRRTDRGDCLPRALVIAWLCARRGHRVEVLFGVADPAEAGLSGHAWAEHAGRPLNDTPDVRARYTVFDLSQRSDKSTGI